jgi:large subunit ribosomal protein L1
MNVSKNNQKTLDEMYQKETYYNLDRAVEIVKETASAKFDETVDLAIGLNVDPRHAEENIRISTSLPNGTGKEVIVLVLAQGPKVQEALDAGADFCGNKEYLDKIKSGWVDVDKIVATPDMMSELGKLGKILGPKGLMPNPKSGTVTMDVSKAVSDLKAGMVELRVEKTGIVHTTCGKVSFKQNALVENILTIYNTLAKARPPSVKGQFMEKISVSSTMGPGVKININSIG